MESAISGQLQIRGDLCYGLRLPYMAANDGMTMSDILEWMLVLMASR